MKKAIELTKLLFSIIHKILMGLGAVTLVFLVEYISKNELFITPGWIKWSLYWILLLSIFFLIGHALRDFEQKSRGVK